MDTAACRARFQDAVSRRCSEDPCDALEADPSSWIPATAIWRPLRQPGVPRSGTPSRQNGLDGAGTAWIAMGRAAVPGRRAGDRNVRLDKDTAIRIARGTAWMYPKRDIVSPFRTSGPCSNSPFPNPNRAPFTAWRILAVRSREAAPAPLSPSIVKGWTASGATRRRRSRPPWDRRRPAGLLAKAILHRRRWRMAFTRGGFSAPSERRCGQPGSSSPRPVTPCVAPSRPIS